MNYRRDEQNFISVQEILDDYVNNSSEKENFPLQVKELGIILKEAFPQASSLHLCPGLHLIRCTPNFDIQHKVSP